MWNGYRILDPSARCNKTRDWDARLLVKQTGFRPATGTDITKGGEFAMHARHVVLLATVASHLSLDEPDICSTFQRWPI